MFQPFPAPLPTTAVASLEAVLGAGSGGVTDSEEEEEEWQSFDSTVEAMEIEAQSEGQFVNSIIVATPEPPRLCPHYKSSVLCRPVWRVVPLAGARATADVSGWRAAWWIHCGTVTGTLPAGESASTEYSVTGLYLPWSREPAAATTILLASTTKVRLSLVQSVTVKLRFVTCDNFIQWSHLIYFMYSLKFESAEYFKIHINIIVLNLPPFFHHH